MKPAFSIVSNGSDITSKLSDRLLSLKVTDEAGNKSDTCEITMDDRGENLELPEVGRELAVSIGYGDELQYMGMYVVDEISLSYPPATIKVRAKAMSLSPGLKTPKTRAWDNQTVAQIVMSIAMENGLVPVVSPEYSSRLVEHMDQTEESDAHFLTRLANIHSAMVKPANKYLIFKALTDIPNLTVSIDRKDCFTFKGTIKDRGSYQQVKTRYLDKDTGEEKTVTVPIEGGGSFGGFDFFFGFLGIAPPIGGGGSQGTETGSVYRDKRVYPSKEEAEWAAKSIGEKITSGLATVDVTMMGRPDVFAEHPVTFSGFRNFTDEQLIVNSVTHTIGNNGYQTKITASNGGGR